MRLSAEEVSVKFLKLSLQEQQLSDFLESLPSKYGTMK